LHIDSNDYAVLNNNLYSDMLLLQYLNRPGKSSVFFFHKKLSGDTVQMMVVL